MSGFTSSKFGRNQSVLSQIIYTLPSSVQYTDPVLPALLYISYLLACNFHIFPMLSHTVKWLDVEKLRAIINKTAKHANHIKRGRLAMCCLQSSTWFFFYRPALNRLSLPVVMVNSHCLCSQGWSKGVVFINGKNLGRYWSIGPQQTLYVPGPWLHRGDNQVEYFRQIHTCSFFVGVTSIQHSTF